MIAAPPVSGVRPHPETRSTVRRVGGVVIGPVLVAAAVVGVWYLVHHRVLEEPRRFILPEFHVVIDSGFLEADHARELFKGLWLTTQVSLLGLALAAIIGIGVGVLMSQARWLENSVFPYAVILQTIPIIAIVPLIGLAFDYSYASRVTVALLIAVFPVITNTLFGLKSADAQQHDLFTLNRAGRLTRLRKLMMPAALPAIFTGLRIAAGASVIGAIVGEFFYRQGVDKGIGRLISEYQFDNDFDLGIAALFLSCLLGIVLFWVITFVGNRTVRHWHSSALPRYRPPRVRASGQGGPVTRRVQAAGSTSALQKGRA